MSESASEIPRITTLPRPRSGRGQIPRLSGESGEGRAAPKPRWGETKLSAPLPNNHTMPRFLLREKLLSFGDDFTIKNASGDDTYFVDGKVFTLRDRLSFQDMHGRELANIHRRLLSLGPTYEIHRAGRVTTV